MNILNGSSSTMLRKRKSYFSACDRTKRRHKNLIEKEFENVDDVCRTMSLQIKSVNLESLSPTDRNSNSRIKINVEKPSENDIATLDEQIFNALQAKDEANLSSRKYRMFRSKLEHLNIPSFYRVKKLQQRLDNLFKISVNHFGAYNNPLQKMTFVCSKFLEHNDKIQNDTFIIKLAADGKVLTRSRVNLLNVTFTIINDDKKAKTSAGHYSLGNFL